MPGGSDTQEPRPSAGEDFYAKDRAFWLTMGRALVIGLMAGAGALAFTQLVRLGTDLLWPDDQAVDWFSGDWWWIVILTLAGVIVGVLRKATRIPDDLDGSLTIVQSASVDRRTALPAIAVSLISLIGGASLGPFDGGTRTGALAGDWYTDARKLPESEREVSTVSGISGSLGGLLTAPVLSTLFLTELRWPERTRLYRVLLPSLVAAIAGFVVVFAVVGDTFLGVFELPGYDLAVWHLALGVAFGIAAATLSWLLGLTVFVVRRWVTPLVGNDIILAAVGGLALGLIAVALPLTLASGKSQLAFAIEQEAGLAAGLLIAVVFAKILAVAISLTTGFIGGPVMPTLFIGGMSGLALHALLPDLPIALVVSCMLVAVPSVSLGAPFTMVFLAVLTVGIGAVETVPAAIAVVTAYTVTVGLGWFGLPQAHTKVDISEVSVQTELFEIGGETET